jgi:hypothetical protein
LCRSAFLCSAFALLLTGSKGMISFFSKFLISRKRSKIVCLNEIEQPEGKAGSQESAGSVERGGPGDGGTNNDGLEFSDQTIRRDLTKSLSYDYHETHRIDDIFMSKHRPLVSKQYEIHEEELIEDPIYDKDEPVEYQINQLVDLKHHTDGSKSTLFEAKIEHSGKLRQVIVKTIRVDDNDVTNSINDFIYERDLLLSLRYSPHPSSLLLIPSLVIHILSHCLVMPPTTLVVMLCIVLFLSSKNSVVDRWVRC